MTMNSFSSVSLNPPLIQFSVGKTAFGLEACRMAKGFAVNILGQDQEALSTRFARPSRDKWHGDRYAPGYEGAPLLFYGGRYGGLPEDPAPNGCPA